VSADPVDVVVVGSGAAGLTAALAARHRGASVLVLEASDRWGGATGASGGIVWAPNNHHLRSLGLSDSATEAARYIELATPWHSVPHVEAFVAAAPRATRLVETMSPIEFRAIAYPDTFSEREGGKPGGRHLEVTPLACTVGRWDEIMWCGPEPFVAISDLLEVGMHRFGSPVETPSILERISKGLIAGGAGLIAGLLAGCDASGVLRRNRHRVIELSPDHAGVTVTAQTAEGTSTITARHGVIVASGGFEWDAELANRHIPIVAGHPGSPPSGRGDALSLLGALGADMMSLHRSWSWPMIEIPDRTWADGTPKNQLVFSEKLMPHSLWVDERGRRFVNESCHNVALSFDVVDPSSHRRRTQRMWAIVDSQFRDRYTLAGSRPDQALPRNVVSAASIDELATLVDVPAGALVDTVERFNADADRGRDSEFSRGESWYERSMGDPGAPHPNLAALDRPPYYAVEIFAGNVGTKGGARVTPSAQVIDVHGQPMPRIYAAGNAMAAIAGPGMIAGGFTIGNALTWGYIAGSACMSRTTIH